ncbi:MAG: YgjV family protein [Pseudomonadota bacterium]
MDGFLGWIANSFFVFGGGFRSPRKTMFTYILGDLIYVAHYCVLGLFTPAVSMACNAGCTLGVLLTNRKYLPYFIAVSLLISGSFILLYMQSAYDLLILGASWCIVFANANKHCYIKYKVATIASQLLWIVFTIHHQDYPMMACCMLILSSNAGSLVHNLVKDRKAQQQVTPEGVYTPV